MKKRIYLASPYTTDNVNLRHARYLAACGCAARLLRQGHLVFSPIVHSHPLAGYDLPIEFDFWKEWCLSFISSWATDLYVLTLYGWRESKGVAAEIEEAKRLGIPVFEYGSLSGCENA